MNDIITANELNFGSFTGERALFSSHNLKVSNAIFDEGESPLKESSDIVLENCSFKYKYPLWYCNNVYANGCRWFEMARAGVWYSNNLTIENAMIIAPKNFRRCNNLTLNNVTFADAQETLWQNDNVTLQNVNAKGDYFAMNCTDIKVDGLKLFGNYSFDGCKNVEVKNSTLMSKDAFWNCENVTVYDSVIVGEYLGWNSKNLTFVNCTIESLQGMCYIENLTMKNCKFKDTTLAFEYSTVDAEIDGNITSVFNPTSGTIKADSIDTLIMKKDAENKTVIICDNIGEQRDEPLW
ncbi:MAG: DUF3737 family protein [Clostridia bacterium]|nr:DUF3737 family protein [Clostridia bacterium]